MTPFRVCKKHELEHGKFVIVPIWELFQQKWQPYKRYRKAEALPAKTSSSAILTPPPKPPSPPQNFHSPKSPLRERQHRLRSLARIDQHNSTVAFQLTVNLAPR